MQKSLISSVCCLILALTACSKTGGNKFQSRLTPAQKLEAATRDGQQFEVAEMAKQSEEFREWQAKRKAGQAVPFDQPDGALAFYAMKRLADGQTAISTASLVTTSAAVTAASAATSGINPAISSGWSPVGPGNVGGRTRAIVINPSNPSVMWAGGVAGGIWKSTNGGASWSPKSDLATNIAISSIILDPRNTSHLYAGTGEGVFNGDAVRGAGILESTDAGESWNFLASTQNSDFYYVQKIVMSKGASQRVYAATRTGVFRSTDNGVTWSKVLDGTSVNGCMDLAIQTDRPLAYVFASCGTFEAANATTGAIYRALDTGSAQTWTKVFNPANMGRTSLALAPSNQNIIYAVAASNESGNFNNGLLGVYRSTTSGSTGSWTTQVTNTSTTTQNRLLLSNPVEAVLVSCGFSTSNAFINQGWYDNTIAVDPLNPNTVWVAGTDIFRSDDGGQNFGNASLWWATPGVDTQYAHADNHTIVFHPSFDGSANQTMYVGNDGGIFTTNNARASVFYSPDPISSTSAICGNVAPGAGVQWTSLNNGYEVSQFYDGAVFPDNSTFFGGLQDNGTQKGTVSGGRNAWTSISGGDGGYVAVNPSNTNMLWGEYTNLSIQRSSNGGTSWSSFTSGIGESSGNFLFIAPFTQDHSNAANMWIGGAYLWRTTHATDTTLPSTIWTQASAYLGQRVASIAVAPSDSNTVYAGGQTGSIWRNTAALSTSSGTTWSSSRVRADTNYISWLAVHPTTPSTVYATVSTFNSGTGSGHVFQSTDGGATWTSIDGSGVTGIPNVPAHTIAIDPDNNSILYVGTDIGVFISSNGGATWTRSNAGFANVIVDCLQIQGPYLYAFTHGRSVWRMLRNIPS